MSNHNICLYKEVKKKCTGCNLKTMEFLDCALIGVCAVIRSNTVITSLLKAGFLLLFFSAHVCIVWSCLIFVQSFKKKSKTVLKLLSRHKILPLELLPRSVTLTLTENDWFMSYAHHLGMANIWAKFKKILQLMKEIWSRHKKLRQTDWHIIWPVFRQAYKNISKLCIS